MQLGQYEDYVYLPELVQSCGQFNDKKDKLKLIKNSPYGMNIVICFHNKQIICVNVKEKKVLKAIKTELEISAEAIEVFKAKNKEKCIIVSLKGYESTN